MNKNKKNLTIATDINGKGGVSTVLKVLEQCGFNAQVRTTLIASHVSGLGWFGLKRLLVFACAIMQVLYYALKDGLGIVHIHMSSRGSYTRKSMIVRLVKKFGGKVIIHLHGAEFHIFYNDECDDRKKAHIRRTYNLADRVIVLSTQCKSWLDTIVKDPDKVVVVYNAVLPPELDEKSTSEKQILFLGSLGHRKGVSDLLEAFAKIHLDFPNSSLVIGGDGDLETYKQRARELGIEDKVKFLGWIAGDDKSNCLSNAYLYSLPSYNEGFPMGILEAMSAHIPVVSTTVGGIPDAVTDKKDGFLHQPGDINELAEILKKLLLDETLAKNIGEAGYQKYKNNFSPEIVTSQLKMIYKELEHTK